MHVVDGGWLLQHVKWTTGATIKTIANNYTTYVRIKFNVSIILFDVFGEELSSKDHEHMQRMAGEKVSLDSMITLELTISCDKEDFLANKNNKSSHHDDIYRGS